MNGTDNIAGYSLTVGTADMVISDSIAQYDPFAGNVADGDPVNYKIQFIDVGLSEDYETGTGVWNSTLATVSRDTVKTSSNGGALVNFGAGPKVVYFVDDYDSIQSMGTKFETSTAKVMTNVERDTIAGLGNSSSLDVGTIAGTVAAGDDARFGSVDYADLDPAAALDGTEIVAVDQGGDGVQTTTQDIAGRPATQFLTLGLNKYVGFSNFSKTMPLFSATNGTLCGLEPYISYFSGTSSGILQVSGYGIFGIGFRAGTGTDTTGKAALVNAGQWLNPFDSALSMDTRFSVALGTILPTTEAFTVQVGFLFNSSYPNLATDGMFFELTSASNNWFACVRDDGVSTRTDTTIAAAVGTMQVLRVFYDADSSSTKFYINETLRATITNATQVVDTGQNLQMVYQIIKSAGTTDATIGCIYHSYEIETSPLVGY